MWPPGYSTIIPQVVVICETFTSKELHFWKQEKVRSCQVRTVPRMLEDVLMELLTQESKIEYTSFGTYLCVLFHTVACDIKALVPWHQFVYTLFIPCDRLVIQAASFRSSFVKRLPARCSFIFGNREKSDADRRDCEEDTRKCPNGSAHAARLVSLARACLFGKIT